MHVPQLEDSCQSEARAWRGVERGLEKQALEMQPCREKGLLQVAPTAPSPLPPPGLTGRGADRGSAPPPQLSCPQKTGQDNR